MQIKNMTHIFNTLAIRSIVIVSVDGEQLVTAPGFFLQFRSSIEDIISYVIIKFLSYAKGELHI